jgi:hypothetical protein
MPSAHSHGLSLTFLPHCSSAPVNWHTHCPGTASGLPQPRLLLIPVFLINRDSQTPQVQGHNIQMTVKVTVQKPEFLYGDDLQWKPLRIETQGGAYRVEVQRHPVKVSKEFLPSKESFRARGVLAQHAGGLGFDSQHRRGRKDCVKNVCKKSKIRGPPVFQSLRASGPCGLKWPVSGTLLAYSSFRNWLQEIDTLSEEHRWKRSLTHCIFYLRT